MRRSGALALALILASCERAPYSDWSRTKTAEAADIADANARTALARVQELQSEAETMGQRIDALEADGREYAQQIRDADQAARAAQAEADRIREHYNRHLCQAHGICG